jgi:hypothetical protein
MTDWIVDSPPSREILPFSKKALQKNTIESRGRNGFCGIRNYHTAPMLAYVHLI